MRELRRQELSDEELFACFFAWTSVFSITTCAGDGSRGVDRVVVIVDTVERAEIELRAPRRGPSRAQEEHVASLGTPGCAAFANPSFIRGRDLVALDERVDLLDPFALCELSTKILFAWLGQPRKSMTRIVFVRRLRRRQSDTAVVLNEHLQTPIATSPPFRLAFTSSARADARPSSVFDSPRSRDHRSTRPAIRSRLGNQIDVARASHLQALLQYWKEPVITSQLYGQRPFHD